MSPIQPEALPGYRTADLVSGGTPQATAHGQRAAWDTALAFLRGVTGGQ